VRKPKAAMDKKEGGNEQWGQVKHEDSLGRAKFGTLIKSSEVVE
jgi:hypothetical protein